MITAPQPENQLSSDETFDLILSGFSFSLKKIKALRSEIGELKDLRDFLKLLELVLAMIFKNGKEGFICMGLLM